MGLRDIPTYVEDPTRHCRITEDASRGRKVFVQTADDILCREEKDDRAALVGDVRTAVITVTHPSTSRQVRLR